MWGLVTCWYSYYPSMKLISELWIYNHGCSWRSYARGTSKILKWMKWKGKTSNSTSVLTSLRIETIIMRMLILFSINNTMILMMILLLYIKSNRMQYWDYDAKVDILESVFSSNIYLRRQFFDQDIQQKQVSDFKVKFCMILDHLWIEINHQFLM